MVFLQPLFFVDQQGPAQAQVVERVSEEKLEESLTAIGVIR